MTNTHQGKPQNIRERKIMPATKAKIPQGTRLHRKAWQILNVVMDQGTASFTITDTDEDAIVIRQIMQVVQMNDLRLIHLLNGACYQPNKVGYSYEGRFLLMDNQIRDVA